MNTDRNKEIEQSLAASLKKGSVEAFDTIYRMYASKLLGYVSQATRNKEDAEEIVHDIFLDLWKSRERLQLDKGFKVLLFSLAYRRRIDYFRKHLKSPIFEDYTNFQNDLVTTDDRPLEYNDFLKIFRKALEGLPEKYERLIILSRFEELTNKEIAKKMNIKERTVANELSLALKYLRSELDEIKSKLYSDLF